MCTPSRAKTSLALLLTGAAILTGIVVFVWATHARQQTACEDPQEEAERRISVLEASLQRIQSDVSQVVQGA